jgi:ZIP Zinc transporter
MSNGAVPWGAGLLAALLVNLVTFIGVLSLLPSTVLSQNVPQHIRKGFVNIIVPSFACGTLFAASIFLIVPESLHLLSGGHDGHDHRRLENSEVDATWKFGASLMGGYLFLFCVNGTFSHHNFNEDSAPQSDPKVSNESQSEIAEQFVDSGDVSKKSVSSIQNEEPPTSKRCFYWNSFSVLPRHCNSGYCRNYLP